MPFPRHFVTRSPGPVAARVVRAARRLRPAGAFALLLSVPLWIGGVANAQTPPSLSGTWQMSCSTNRGTRQVTLHVVQNGPKLSGAFSGPRRSGKLSGSVRGGQVTLKMGKLFRSITFTGTAAGNSMTVHSQKGLSCSVSRQ